MPSTPRSAVRRRVRRTPLAQARRGSIGCGVDVVELPRFKQALKRGGQAFLRRIFTPAEEAYARRRHRTTLLHLAGRFAAKEAVLKAISQIDPTRVLAMNQVEVCNDQAGRPHIVLLDGRPSRHRGGEGSGARRGGCGRTSTMQVHVSLSHVKTVAVASAIAIR